MLPQTISRQSGGLLESIPGIRQYKAEAHIETNVERLQSNFFGKRKATGMLSKPTDGSDSHPEKARVKGYHNSYSNPCNQ